MRDEQVQAFDNQMSPGTRELVHLTRALTPGRFRAPPARAEEMYRPETFGRSAGHWVVVVPPDRRGRR